MYNDIKYHHSKHEPIIPTYMNKEYIILGEGRQLFVDIFLIKKMTNCSINYYQPEKYKNNPILKPNKNENKCASPNMDAIIYDPYSCHFKMWYVVTLKDYPHIIKLAISDDGITWYKPIIYNKDIVHYGNSSEKCNILREKLNKTNNNILCLLGCCHNGKGRGSSSQILDMKETNRNKLFKMVWGGCNFLNICESKDGIIWKLSNQKSGWGGGSPWYLNYNPFKKNMFIHLGIIYHILI